MESSKQPSPFKAAIDIGTNSMHLVVARIGEHGGFEMLTSEKEMVRLGRGGGEMKLLADDAIERGIAALARMSKVAASFGEVDLVVVATSAVREAANKADFLDRARNELGIDVEVISGFEEARLIHLGVLQALPVFDRRLLVVDIGGGSTEFLIGQGARALEARSMKLGAIRLTERFFADAIANGNAPTDDDVVACRRYVRAALASVAHELGGHQPEIAVASSGTATTIAAIAAANRGDSPRQMNGVTFNAAELAEVVAAVTTRSTSERGDITGLDEKRIDIILGGAILLDEIVRAFDLDGMTISDFALREGVLFDRFGAEAGHELSDLRGANVRRLARQLDPDADHAEHTAKLALQLFDRTNKLHGLGDEERELLEAAAILHNVGLFISHSAHHKHSYYVIRNSEQLTGFTDHEIELIAVVARYHRKSQPTEKHAEFAALSKFDKARVRSLGGLLRVAIGLDRRHSAAVESIRTFVDGDGERLTIEPLGEDGVDLELEIYAANERSKLLSDALGLEVTITPARVFDGEHISS